VIDIFLTVLSALVLATCYLGSPFGAVSFVALVPFFHSVYSTGKKDSFRLGFLWGLAFFGPVLWWIAPTISTYGKLPLWASWIIFGALACYLALYPALWAFLSRWVLPEKKDLSCLGVLALASLWILLEFLRGTVFSGFPWGSLAYSLCKIPLLIQTADLFGPYGVGFTIIFTNLALWQLILALENREFFRVHRTCICRCTAVALALVASMMIYGRHVLSAHERGNTRVAALQGSFDQSVKWDPMYRTTGIGVVFVIEADICEVVTSLYGSGNPLESDIVSGAVPSEGYEFDRSVRVFECPFSLARFVHRFGTGYRSGGIFETYVYP